MKALVLGGTYPHKHLINLLKKRGYHVTLADYLENPPAKIDADEHICASTLNKEKILQIAEERKIDSVITACIDQANVTACYVAEKLNLPHPYSYETALNVTDKSRMKKFFIENKILSPKYFVVDSLEGALNVNLKYPVIVKPTDATGSKGVFKCKDKVELAEKFPETYKTSRNKKVIVEEFIEGTEISYCCFIGEPEVFYINSNQKILFKSGTEGVLQCGAGIYPADIPDETNLKMKKIVEKLRDIFNFSNTPIFVQAIVTPDGLPYVLEFAPRVPGGLSFRVMEKMNRFDIIDATINSFLGKYSTPKIFHPDYFSAVMNIYCRQSAAGGGKNTSEFIDAGFAKEFHQYKKFVEEIPGGLTAGSRFGSFLLQGKSPEDVREKIRYINKNFEVFDSGGAATMRHDIYDL